MYIVHTIFYWIILLKMAIDIWWGGLWAVYLWDTLIAGWGWWGWGDGPDIIYRGYKYVYANFLTGCLNKCSCYVKASSCWYCFLLMWNAYDNTSWWEAWGLIYNIWENKIYSFPYARIWCSSTKLCYGVFNVWNDLVVWYHSCYYHRWDSKTHYRYCYINPNTCTYWCMDCLTAQHSSATSFSYCWSCGIRLTDERWWKCVIAGLCYLWCAYWAYACVGQ